MARRYDSLAVDYNLTQNGKSNRGNCKSMFILLLIFVVCAPIAFVLSELFLFSYSSSSPDHITTTVSPTTTTLPPPESCRKRVIGYYTEWESPEVSEKQLKKLTHVIYLFAVLQDNGAIKLDNERTETRFLDMKNKAIPLKSKGLKMMIGVGGHATSHKFSSIASDAGKRKTLINSITHFIDEHDLDGVDIFWIWPSSSDKLHYSKFIRELRKQLDDMKQSKKRNEDYLISVIVPPSISGLDSGYYLNDILKSVDFLNVLTYDYYFNGNRVGPHSPIYGGTRGNIDETMRYLACKTRQPSKINMAVPFYGTFWSNASLPLSDDSDDIWKEIGNAKGHFAVRWRELIPNEWDVSTTRFHEKSKTSYIWIPETKHFLTFENERSLKEKAKYVKENGLGGMLIWAIDQDDNENTLLNVASSADICLEKKKNDILGSNRRCSQYEGCCKAATVTIVALFVNGILAFVLSEIIWHFYGDAIELLPTISAPVSRGNSKTPSTPKPLKNSIKTTVLPTTTTTTSTLPPHEPCQKRVIGYYSEWENPEVSEKQLKKLTHVIYLFAVLQDNGTIKLENERTKARFLDLKKKAVPLKSEGLKVMIGVGGHATSHKFSPIVSDAEKRKILINSITSFIDEHDLNGVDIFWIWPSNNVRLEYSNFINDLRKQLDNMKKFKKRSEAYLISVIVPPSISELDSAYYLHDILKSVDFLNVLTYDYYFNGNRVGPHSPIYGGSRGNIDETMKYLVYETRQPSKLNMAVPFYGSYFINASLPLTDDSDDIWKEIGNAEGAYAVRWRQLIPNKWDVSTTRFHEKSKTSYIWVPATKTFLTFENERSLKEKTKYVKENGLGGMLIWAIDQDDEDNTLLNVVSSEMLGKKEKE